MDYNYILTKYGILESIDSQIVAVAFDGETARNFLGMQLEALSWLTSAASNVKQVYCCWVITAMKRCSLNYTAFH